MNMKRLLVLRAGGGWTKKGHGMEETWEKKRRKEKEKSRAKPRVFVCFVLRAGGRWVKKGHGMEEACFRVFCAACWRTMSQERTRMEETWEKKSRKEKGKSKAKPRVFVCFVLRAGGRWVKKGHGWKRLGRRKGGKKREKAKRSRVFSCVLSGLIGAEPMRSRRANPRSVATCHSGSAMIHGTVGTTLFACARLLQWDEMVITKANLWSLRSKLCKPLELRRGVHRRSALKVCFSPFG